MTDQFEPTIIGFTCNWCSYRAADLAGTARIKYPPNVRLIRLMCSGRLDPTFVFKALASGADGVMITGCHPGDCHFRVWGLNQRAFDWSGLQLPREPGSPARSPHLSKKSAHWVRCIGVKITEKITLPHQHNNLNLNLRRYLYDS
jgi:hypothetical protein